MKLFTKHHDGGPESGVTGYWLIEWKSVFSIVLLGFTKNSKRNELHSHAFHALTWWLKGSVQEYYINGDLRLWRPSLRPKFTPRDLFHRVKPETTGGAWALSFRGPWASSWQEFNPKTNQYSTLTSGRKAVAG